MATTTLSKLITSIKSRDWVQANEGFANLMTSKVADRIQTERASIGSVIFKEENLREGKYCSASTVRTPHEYKNGKCVACGEKQ